MRKIVSLFITLICFVVLATAQQRAVTGRVADSADAAISGATITIKGTRTAVSADQNGNFKINAKTGDVLVVTGVGITTQEVTVTSASSLNVVSSRQNQNLAEVVVTAQGVRRQARSLGYSVSRVDPNTLLQKSEPDVLKGLQGKVAGVDIRSGQGTPGAATRIQIRGNSSFFGDNQPLIIVDGIPYSNDQVSTGSAYNGGGAYSSGLSSIDPNDIASMNILKGSSAGALYGSRASNGVIIITTKSGSVGRVRKGTEVTVKSSISIETIANLPNYQNSYGTGSQGNAGGGSNGSWGARFGTIDSVGAWQSYLTAYPELFPNGKVAYKAYPNNVKDLFTTGVVTENSVGFNTGDEKTSFSVTGSQLQHNGYLANNKYNRTNFSAGGSSKLSIGLNVRANFSYTRSKQQGGIFGENQSSSGYTSSQFARSMFLGRSWDVHLPFEDKNGNSISWVGTQADHPFWAAKYNKQITNEERTVAGLHLDYNLTNWARLDYNIGNNVALLNRREIAEVSSRGTTGRLALDNYRKDELESTLLLSITPNLGEDFSLKATAGTSYNQRTTTRVLGKGGYPDEGATGGYIVRGIYTLDNFKNTDRSISDFYDRRRLLGILGDLTVGYKNYAFLTLTGRNDISSTLPANNRSYFYPAISGSLVFTDALKVQSDILSFGKIRAGYAKVGRDADPYNIFNTYLLGPSAFVGQSFGTVNPASNGGSLLQPEFTKELELGTQLSFFNKKFDVDFTYYDKRSSNMIAPVTTASSTGYESFYTNFGGISNKGIEVEATVRPVTNKNFSWELRGILTKNKSIVTSLAEGLTSLNLGGGTVDATTQFEVGKPFGFLYGTKSLRDSATGELLIDPATGSVLEDPNPGMIGNPNPDYKLGITNNFTYKGFVLSVLFDMTKGGALYSVTNSSLLGRGVTLDTEDRQTGWVIPGIYGSSVTQKAITGSDGKTIRNQTRMTTNDLYFSPGSTGGTFAINTSSDWNVYDATVYRLREISLGYEIPKSLFKNTFIGSITASLTARNLWYLAPNFPKNSNFDPETSSYGSSSVQGLEISAAPTTRRFGFNLNVTF